MKTIITSSGQIGKFAEYEILDDRYVCDDIEYQFSVLGETHEIGDYVEPALATEELNAIKARVWEEIKKYRDNLVENGGFKVGAHWYHSNLLSRTQYISLVMMGASIPAGTVWKTLDNGYIPMTQTLAGQIFTAGAAQDAALFAKAAEHKTALDASSDPANYDYTTGWPETYTGA